MAAELLGLYEVRRRSPGEWPGFLRFPTYWLLSMAMSGFGALLVLAYTESDIDLSPILALNIGASAPLILSGLVRATPEVPPGTVE
jgi:hypothetical protein